MLRIHLRIHIVVYAAITTHVHWDAIGFILVTHPACEEAFQSSHPCFPNQPKHIDFIAVKPLHAVVYIHTCVYAYSVIFMFTSSYIHKYMHSFIAICSTCITQTFNRDPSAILQDQNRRLQAKPSHTTLKPMNAFANISYVTTFTVVYIYIYIYIYMYTCTYTYIHIHGDIYIHKWMKRSHT